MHCLVAIASGRLETKLDAAEHAFGIGHPKLLRQLAIARATVNLARLGQLAHLDDARVDRVNGGYVSVEGCGPTAALESFDEEGIPRQFTKHCVVLHVHGAGVESPPEELFENHEGVTLFSEPAVAMLLEQLLHQIPDRHGLAAPLLVLLAEIFALGVRPRVLFAVVGEFPLCGRAGSGAVGRGELDVRVWESRVLIAHGHADGGCLTALALRVADHLGRTDEVLQPREELVERPVAHHELTGHLELIIQMSARRR